jgi:hypothetical protein
VVFDLAPAELGVIRVVGLLAKVQVDEERPDVGVIARGKPLNVKHLHRQSMVAEGPRKRVALSSADGR